MSNIPHNLPKAPSSINANLSDNDMTDEINDALNMDDIDDNIDITEDDEEVVDETPTQYTSSKSNDVVLADISDFEKSVNAAKRARALAATYVNFAKNHELPHATLLQNDDALLKAIEETLIKRANDFHEMSRTILKETLNEDPEKTKELLNSKDVLTIDALYELNQGPHQTSR